MTYMVRPFMAPVYSLLSLAYISSGIHPVVGGPASSCFLQQMNVRPSTRSHVVGSGAVKIAAGQLFLIQLLQLTSGRRPGPAAPPSGRRFRRSIRYVQAASWRPFRRSSPVQFDCLSVPI